MKLRQLTIMLVALLLLSVHGRISAQTITGVISGTVTDPSGQVIPGASVTLTNEGTVETRTIAADGAGNFVFPGLLPGAYTVKVEAQGFQTLQRTGNRLTPSQRLAPGNLQLSIAAPLSHRANIPVDFSFTPICVVLSQRVLPLVDVLMNM